MERPDSFGYWLEKRRKALDLTRNELAQKVSCSISTLRKIEADERRPSKQLAELIANALEVRMDERETFLRIARGELTIERLKSSPPIPDLNVLQSSVNFLKNIPVPPTPLIGRETELAVLRQMFKDPQCKLITLVGLGGSGKTRLALHTGEQLQADFTHGVAFIPLASVDSVDAAILAIASGIHLHFYGLSEPGTQLLNYLAEKQMLLILDNVEQLLIEGTSKANIVELALKVLQIAPRVKLLVTSREALRLQGEWVFEVSGLAFPDAEQVGISEEYAAISLFTHHARRVSPGFAFNETDLSGIADICRLVEGMPLAIELAATWLRLLSPAEIAKEIDSGLDILSATLRDLPERHRSMRVVFDYSWQRLSTDEQQVLCQLSVFRGGFTRQAAEKVASASLSVLSALVNQTLLRRVAAGRYGLHELIRQYSATHLATDPQAQAETQKRHYDYFLALAETAEQELKGQNQLEWLGCLEQELDNLRAALEWALESDRTAHGGDEFALRLSGVLHRFWWLRGHFHEGRSWLTKSLQQHPENHTAARAAALLANSSVLYALGDIGAACRPVEESMAIYRELGDQRGLAKALRLSGATLLCLGEASLGQARLEEALAICRKSGDRQGEGGVLFSLGIFLSEHAGDPAGRVMLEECAEIFKDGGEKYTLNSVLISLGNVDIGLGDYTGALKRLEHGLSVAREIEYPVGMADSLTSLGCVYRILGQYSTAQSFLEEALGVYQYLDSIWETDVLCALAENAISQKDLTTARIRLLAAANHPGISEDKWHQALIDYFRGLLAYYEGDAGAAMMLLDKAIVLAREGQFKPHLARSLVALGRVRLTLDQALPASKLLREGLGLFQALGNNLGIASAIEELGAVNSFQGDYRQAVILISTAHAMREVLGAPLPLIDRAAYDSVLTVCRTQLGEEDFAYAWTEGEALSMKQAIDLALDK